MSASTDVQAAGATRTDRALARYVARTVYPYSAYYRTLLDRVGLGARGIHRAADLSRLPPTDLARVDPGEFVLRPDLGTIRRLGARRLAARALWAQLIGSMGRFNRDVIEPQFKPIHWLCSRGTPMGYSARDLERLGQVGARWLRLAGVRPNDVLVSLMPPAPTPGYWILVQGARRARVAAAHLGPADAAAVAALGPTVVVGRFPELAALLSASRDAGTSLSNLGTIICLFEGEGPDPNALSRLASLAGGAPVVAGWAAPGTRTVWTECREGAERRREMGGLTLHTWPDVEVVEIVDAVDRDAVAAEVLWTGIGWTGSAALRIRTAARAVIDLAPCAACGRAGPRLAPAAGSGLATVLDARPEVVAWQAERRVAGGEDQLIVTLAVAPGVDVASLVGQLDPALGATQYIVLDRSEVEARIATAAGARQVVRP